MTELSQPLVPDGIPLYKLDKVHTQVATPPEETFANIIANVKRGLPKFNQLPEFHVFKNNVPIALIGGGPSVRKTIGEAKKFNVTVACGSSHDWLVENDLIPTYCVLCDPDAITANYVQKANDKTCFLVSSGCNEKVFEVLKGKNIVLWHCHSDDYNTKNLNEIDPDYFGVGGGCTVGLRAISIAMSLGYGNIHFFGFDSCLGEEDLHHAYDFSTNTEELGVIHEVRMGYKDDLSTLKLFRCAGYQLAQAMHFKDYYVSYGNIFTPTFHGEGLLATFMDIVRIKEKKLKELAKTQHTEFLGVVAA